MEVQMDDFTVGEEESCCFSFSEFDPDYEFDASKFFDFTRQETESEAQEAEEWFQSASSYPPSPFIVKLKLEMIIPAEVGTANSQKLVAGARVSSVSTISDVEMGHEVSSLKVKKKVLKQHNHAVQDILNDKAKSVCKSFKPRSSTLMRPTASHLAKQRNARSVHSGFRGRLKPSVKEDETKFQNIPGLENQATKRQKLECGYLRKAAHLRHQNSFLHKLSKKVGHLGASSIYSRSKATVPREPDLETAQRAQRRSIRYQNIPESGQLAKQNLRSFKARPLNRKILEAPSLPHPKKSMPQLPEFHEFHLKTTQRAKQHLSSNGTNTSHSVYDDKAIKRPNSRGDTKQEKCPLPSKVKAHRPDKVFPINEHYGSILNVKPEVILQGESMSQNDNMLTENPPTELFKKLSLRSDSVTKTKSQSKQHLCNKGLKENTPTSFQHEFLKCAGKVTWCGSNGRAPEVGSQPKSNRSIGIR